MSTAYRVNRPEPLAVNDIKVVFQGTLDDLNTLTEVEGDDSWDDDDQHDAVDREDREDDEGYVKSTYALITGKTTRLESGRRLATWKQICSGPQGCAEQREPLVSISERAANRNTLL
jgi:hypothetical protein